MAKFVYYNINPRGKRENDCVTRAIALALNKPYERVSLDLTMSANRLNCDRLYICCYRNLLDNIYKLPEVYAEGYTVGEFADANPVGTFLVRIDGHLSCIIDNIIYDIWDCRGNLITNAWQVD